MATREAGALARAHAALREQVGETHIVQACLRATLRYVDVVERERDALRKAVHDLYYAAYWKPDRQLDNERQLWEAVRDAARFEPGESPERQK